ncbi:4-hydroxy-3-methylbut-2-enyl diphosphate reductase [Fluviicola chungangensis]|uniref:4-hydroxy-3-methylbut-2-enyl diphosphate reductase n=1 Tax=Fluviicola chungangensis TaxID=2597671 RepID=A0A556N7D5_9FLAO|nr:4-hydroxy-3-methylbut-2-enyl diphosphate reductase [Fluviicola chungangensis]TSJ48092.1 4-hydroxy-3-methylbut-2-enyl diphosphate reductase [Fluviicola chungangensis]
MKQFDIPSIFRSPIISKVKAFRKSQDPRKKDFSPTVLDFGNVQLFIARHFGFCYGVENAIEIAYRAVEENAGKRIFLLSQMIHNPTVNADLTQHGIRFIQDTSGKQLIPWEELNPDDMVIIPAFGTTLEIEQILTNRGVSTEKYDTTCPFVEKVWNRAEKLGTENHTLVIHGKYDHEETRATFSHAALNAEAVIVKNMEEAAFLAKCITGEASKEEFYHFFKGKHTLNFDPEIHLSKIGVINQTTMLASETQKIAEFLKTVTEEFAARSKVNKTVADTRDTLCYATSDNQSATEALMNEPLDYAIVVGGYNSSNTSHLVELLEQGCPVYFIKDETEIVDMETIRSFNRHTHEVETIKNWMRGGKVGITSGASCPDSIIDLVITKVLRLANGQRSIDEVINDLN